MKQFMSHLMLEMKYLSQKFREFSPFFNLKGISYLSHEEQNKIITID